VKVRQMVNAQDARPGCMTNRFLQAIASNDDLEAEVHDVTYDGIIRYAGIVLPGFPNTCFFCDQLSCLGQS